MAFRRTPSASRQLGLPGIGFEFTPPDIEVTPVGEIVRCSERREDGRAIGELEISVFAAGLIIDRDGVLEDKARTIADSAALMARGRVVAAVPISLPGGSGYRADVEMARGAAFPYVHVFAIAPNDLGIQAGVLVIVRSTSLEWPAAEAIVSSLRILTRNGVVQNDPDDHPPLFPLLGKRSSND